jgi:hypothetical protein
VAIKQEMIDLLDLKGAMDRAFRTGERASQQFTKLLGIIHGGLGVTLAAWLQRLFEAAAEHKISPLAWYLAIAMTFTALGLLTLVLAAIYDQLAAVEYVYDAQLSNEKIIAHEATVSAQKLDGDERAKAEGKVTQDRTRINEQATVTARKAKRYTVISKRVGIVSWLCAVAAFMTLAIGIFSNISRL